MLLWTSNSFFESRIAEILSNNNVLLNSKIGYKNSSVEFGLLR